MANFIVGGIIALIFIMALAKVIRDKKNGVSSCGCDCGSCGSACAGKGKLKEGKRDEELIERLKKN